MRDEGSQILRCVRVSQMEEEQDPEERDQFLQQLYKFMEDRGQFHVCSQGKPNHLKPRVMRILLLSSLDI